MNVIRFFVTSLARNPVKTVLTLITVGLGVAVLVIALSLSSTFSNILARELESEGAVITFSNAELDTEGNLLQIRPPQFDENVIEIVRSDIGGVEAAAPAVTPDWSNVKGGAEVAGTFREMGSVWGEIMDSFQDMAGGSGFLGSDDHFANTFNKINGFPVVTRDFEDGELDSETVLESVTERDLDPDAFEPPKGYRLRTMGPQ